MDLLAEFSVVYNLGSFLEKEDKAFDFQCDGDMIVKVGILELFYGKYAYNKTIWTLLIEKNF